MSIFITAKKADLKLFFWLLLATTQPLVCGIGGIGVAYGAQTNPLDNMNLLLSETLTYDDNLFRLPDGVSPSAGGSSRSSLIRTDSLGIAWDETYSLQRFQLKANVEHHDYSDHDFLNFNGVNGSFAWDWSLTPHLTGVLFTDRNEALESFTDYRNQTSRNLRVNQSRVAAADYEAYGSWHLIGAIIDYSSVSDNNLLPVEDSFKSHGMQAGIKYVFSSANYVSYTERSENGEYPGQDNFSTTLIDSEFHQHSREFKAVWAYTPQTILTGRITDVDRDHPNFTQRNYSGTTGRADISWKPTGRASILASASRDFATYQTLYSNYISSDILTIAPAWQLTAKSALKWRFSRAWRSYLGEPFGPVPMRKDIINSSQIEIDWDATRNISVAAALLHESRDSSYSGFAYTDTAATVNLRISF